MEKAILKDGIRRELNTAAFTENGAVSITDYGADPTGKEDSTAAIEKAHFAGKTVYYPDGRYIFNGENLDMSHGVIFQSHDGVLVHNNISDEPVIVFDDLGNLVGLRQGHSETADGDSEVEITSGNLVPPPLSQTDYRLRADLMVHFYNDFGKKSTLYQPGWKGWYNWAWNYHRAGRDGDCEKLRYHAERNPYLGFYRGDDSVVLDWICYWLAEYGVTGVFITAGGLEKWEDPKASDYWVWQLFNQTPNFGKLRYGITMPGWFREKAGEEDINLTRAAIRSAWKRVLELTYFSPDHKNAYTMNIDGKAYPVLFLFEENYLTYMLDGYSGTDGCLGFLAEISEKFRDNGFPGFALVIRQRKGRLTENFAKSLEKHGVYIFTGYYEQGFVSAHEAAPGTPYSEMIDGMDFPERFDGRIAHVFTGANTLGSHPSCWDHPGNTPELFEKMLEKAVEYTENSGSPRLITCYNVSEWSEGGPGLQPNMKDGFGYLDACYNVLVRDNESTTDQRSEKEKKMKPYSVNVPVPLKMLTPENRVKYLKTLKRTVADRIFISISHLSDCGSIDWELLADNVRYFSENGIEAAVWFGETLGHGCCISGIGTPKDEPAIRNFTKIHGITGEENRFSFCPLDDGFADFFADNVKKAAATGTKLIILDDDFRLSLRDYGIGCACPLHMKKISALLGGEEITHGTLTKHVIHGSPNLYRDAWLKAQGDSLRSLASKLRAACDSIDPTVRMGIMDCYTLWDVDGVTAAELSTILAGNAGKPFIRVSGAPYWGSRRDPDLPGVFEIMSLHMSFIPEDHGGEYIGEGDVYPSPRYNCPAAYQDIHDAFLRAEGSLDGDLKFMVNYTSLPGYETGYEEKHIRSAEKLKSFGKIFADGKRTGVRVYEYRDKMKTADFPEPGFDALSVLSRYPYPHGGIMTASAGIPTVYKGSAAYGVLFGENARHIDINELGNGLVLDASAALILKERGIDTGIKEPNSLAPGNVSAEVFGNDGLTVVINDGGARLLTASLSPSAVIESTGNTSLGTIPLSYRYENAEGQKFLVYLFDSLELSRTTGLFFTYARKEQLISALEWISGAPLPVVPENRAPFVYLLTKETDRGLAVGVFNCFADEVLSPSFRVSEIFTEVDFGSHTEKINNRTVTADCDIPPFGYIAFTLR